MILLPGIETSSFQGVQRSGTILHCRLMTETDPVSETLVFEKPKTVDSVQSNDHICQFI